MKKIILSIVLTILLVSCNDKNKRDHYNYNQKEITNGLLDFSTSNTTIDEISIKKPQKESNKIIKTSNLKFETNSVEKTFTTIKKQLAKSKGFIQNDNTYKNDNKIQRELLIRIPTNEFQVVIDSISSNVHVFDYKNISLKDVTEEFIDLNARLKAKKTLENRYLQLLSKAKNVEEMLNIEREIAKIREEIEAKQGRLNYLNDQVSFSTINITFYETVEVVKSKSKTYFSQVIKAIKGGFTSVGNFILRVLYLWPYIIIAIPIILFIRKKLKKKLKK